ncbi:MAG: hypothetical protein U0229_07205 [Anaeromyxobacter sp.]
MLKIFGPADEKRRREVIKNLSRIFLGGVPSLLNDDGAYLSFVCSLTAMETLGSFILPHSKNGPRFREFVHRYLPDPLRDMAQDLWALRNDAVHGFSTGPFALTHHHTEQHLTTGPGGILILNAEDFYAALVSGAQTYFRNLETDGELRAAFSKRIEHANVLTIGKWPPRPRRADEPYDDDDDEDEDGQT